MDNKPTTETGEKSLKIAGLTGLEKLLTSQFPQAHSSKLIALEKARLSPYREMTKEQADTLLKAEITYCATTYLGIQEEKNDKEVINEAVRFVISKFAFLGKGEIREAFSMASAGLFEGPHLRAYYGILTVEMLGSVLSAYREYRKTQVAIIEKVKDEEKARAKEEHIKVQNERARQEIIKSVKNHIEAGGNIDWRGIPVNWAELVKDIYPLTQDEKLEIWERAKQIVMDEEKEKYEDKASKGILIEARNIRDFLKGIEEKRTESTDKLKSKANPIYAKLYIIKIIEKYGPK